MKYQKKKNIQLNSKFLRNLLIFLMIFILIIFGIWIEKYDLFKKPNDLAKRIYENLYGKVISEFYENEKIIIDIDYKNFNKIKKSRELALRNQRLRDSDTKWVNASLVYKNEKKKIKIKLKGMLGDHWQHPYKWSFSVKMDSKNQTVFNLRRFVLQSPKTLDFISEWLFMKVLEKEGLISHRTKFVDLIVNGNKYGAYILQERGMKELIENNNRREGPIIVFDNELKTTEHINYLNLGINKVDDYFWRSKISPIQFKKNYKNTEQEIFLSKAVTLLEKFRSKEKNAHEVFDTEQLAKIMAIRAIFGSLEFDVDDLRFYFNPVTNLLEPISREIHSDPGRFINYGNSWVFEVDKIRFPWQRSFLEILYDDKIFYENFLTKLGQISEIDYLYKIISENRYEYDNLIKILRLNFPSEKITSLNDYIDVAKFISDTLNPIQKPKVNMIQNTKDYLILNITNTQIMPLEIIGINMNDKKIDFENFFLINGGNISRQIRIDCKSYDCSDDHTNKMSLKYKVIGQNRIGSVDIDYWSNSLNFKSFNKDNSDIFELIKKYPFLKLENNFLILDKDFDISEQIIIPQGYILKINAGVKVNFLKKGQLISFSPVHFNGTETNQIIITSNYNKKVTDNSSLDENIENEYGYGILILKTGEKKSFINHTNFINLSAPNEKQGIGTLGAINFYEADVEITNSSFIKNIIGDDYLNIIRSNFSIFKTIFKDTNSDAIDIDFSNGNISESTFVNSGNDSLDFSGSRVNLKNIYIDGAGDKGISAGEKSNIIGENIYISNSNIGVASKDLSLVLLNDINIKYTNIGLASYQKKTEYGPAKIVANDIMIENLKNNFVPDLSSKIEIDNQTMPNIDCKAKSEICTFFEN
jgi:hypothetical protein